MEYKDIVVIILNYNSSTDTIELYGQLKKFYKGILINVIDNNSTFDDKENLALNISSDYIFYNTVNLGYAGGNNIGIKKAIDLGAKYVWILNPDIRVDKRTLPILLETIQNNNNIAAVGPRICYKSTPSKIYSDGGLVKKELGYFITHLNTGKNIFELKETDSIQNVDYVNGSVMLVKLDVFKEIGCLFEDFFLYFEETEWCLRASEKKYKLLTNTQAIAYHMSSNKDAIYWFYMTRNKILLAKHQNEYYWKTVWIVCKSISPDLLIDLKKMKLRQKTKSRLKGLVFGIFSKLKK